MYSRRGIVNSISLKEGEELFIKQATCIKYGASVVVMALTKKDKQLVRMIK